MSECDEREKVPGWPVRIGGEAAPAKIEPALTPEEWDASEGDYIWRFYEVRRDGKIHARVENAEHKTAALCLFGQTFGFTREDVTWLRECMSPETDSIADRIEALLPPE